MKSNLYHLIGLLTPGGPATATKTGGAWSIPGVRSIKGTCKRLCDISAFLIAVRLALPTEDEINALLKFRLLINVWL